MLLQAAGEGGVVASTVLHVSLGTGPGIGGAFLTLLADLDVLRVGVENGLVSAEAIITLQGSY